MPVFDLKVLPFFDMTGANTKSGSCFTVKLVLQDDDSYFGLRPFVFNRMQFLDDFMKKKESDEFLFRLFLSL